jgi:MFS family permease
MASVLGLYLFCSSATTPLYVVYQADWHFPASTLTAIFSVYALALLLALTVAGSISDRAGRRRVILAAIVLQTLAMVIFVLAHSVGALYLARIVQGVATGIATGAVSAAIIDLQPPHNSRLGALVAATAPGVGLVIGALGSGVVVQFAPYPLRLIYLIEILLLVLAGVAVALSPETIARRPGWWRTFRVAVAVPRPARAVFWSLVPGMIATWALGGLYLSLGPTLAAGLLHSHSHIVGALVPATLSATSALSSVLTRGWFPRRAILLGDAALALGVGLTMLATDRSSTTLFFSGAAVAGLGFGSAFAASFRAIAPLAPPNARAALLAAIYIVCYLAFSIPSVLAGLSVIHQGLHRTSTIFGTTVILLALCAAGAYVRATARSVVTATD